MWPQEFSEQQRRWTWRAYLRSGVTSVVSVGDDKDIILGARYAEREGTLEAPRIFACGSIFTALGGHPVSTILGGEASRFRDIALEVGDPAEAREQLRRLVTDDDIDVVKLVYSTIPGNVPRLGRAVLEALVDEAQSLERPVFAHVSTPEEAADCVAAGVTSLEHMVLGDSEILAEVFAMAAERQVSWTPTLCLFDKFVHDGDDGYLDAYEPHGTVSRTVLRSLRAPGARWRRPEAGAPQPPWARTIQLAGGAHRAGVRLPLGTDAGNPAVFHGLAVHRELELLVRGGLSPMEALTSATGVAAEKVGAGRTLGTIEAGKEADLVVVGANPLDDIRNSRKVELVMKRGRLFDPKALAVP